MMMVWWWAIQCGVIIWFNLLNVLQSYALIFQLVEKHMMMLKLNCQVQNRSQFTHWPHLSMIKRLLC